MFNINTQLGVKMRGKVAASANSFLADWHQSQRPIANTAKFDFHVAPDLDHRQLVCLRFHRHNISSGRQAQVTRAQCNASPDGFEFYMAWKCLTLRHPIPSHSEESSSLSSPLVFGSKVRFYRVFRVSSTRTSRIIILIYSFHFHAHNPRLIKNKITAHPSVGWFHQEK